MANSFLLLRYPMNDATWSFSGVDDKNNEKKVNQFPINRDFIGQYIDGILIKKIGFYV